MMLFTFKKPLRVSEINEKALGITWNIESDNLLFDLTLKTYPLTKRGILSSLSSLYNPLGLISPFYLEGKRILQDLHQLNLT